MITSLILFVLSGLFAAYMFFSRRDALEDVHSGLESAGNGDEAVRSVALLSQSICSTELDTRLRSLYQRVETQIRLIDGPYLKEKMHALAAHSEKWVLAILSKLLNRFGKLRDVVTGKDLPKNKGSVSFFLKHIQHHKSQLAGYLKDEKQRTLDPRLQKKLEINRK